MTQKFIPGPIQITIQGPQGSGKTQLAQVIRKTLESLEIGDRVTFTEEQNEPAPELLEALSLLCRSAEKVVVASKDLKGSRLEEAVTLARAVIAKVVLGRMKYEGVSIVLGYDPHLAGPGFTVNGVASFDLASAIAFACDLLRHQGVPIPDDFKLPLIFAAPAMADALKPFARAHATWNGGNAAQHFSQSVSPADFLRAAEALAKAGAA